MLIADKINDILPQTQCRQCSFSGCRPYAEAISQGDADINQCPPGGMAGITKIAHLLGRDPKPLNTTHGEHKPKMLAVIDESTCIGCTLCIKACPVDAIVGARKLMHTVIAQACTGCELCVAPCPVDCIALVPVAVHDGEHWPQYRDAEVARARDAYARRALRTQRARRPAKQATGFDREQAHIVIAAAVARARAKKPAHDG